MSLEIALQENTNAIHALIATLSKGVPTTAAQVAAVVAEAPTEAVAAEPKKTTKAEKPAKAEAKSEAPKEEAPVAAAAAAEAAPAPTYEDVKKAILALSSAKGRDTVVKLLGEHDVKAGPELKPEQYPDFLAACTEAMGA